MITVPAGYDVKLPNTDMKLEVYGIVSSGQNKATGMIEKIIAINGYSCFQYIPYPGTLNVDISIFSLDTIHVLNSVIEKFPKIYDSENNLYYVGEILGETVYLIAHDNKIEMIARNKLRTKFSLKDGDLIIITSKDVSIYNAVAEESVTNRPSRDLFSLREKFLKDAALLEAELEQNPNDSRSRFYLAQSYRDAGELTKAIEHYALRAQMGGWQEEVFYSLYQIGRHKEQLGHADDEVLAAYAAASAAHPKRAEAIHAAARYCRIKKLYEKGYEISKSAVNMHMCPPEGALFEEPTVYTKGLLDEFSINAYWAGHYDESLDACLKLLGSGKFEDADVARIEKNAEFARKKLQQLNRVDVKKIVEVYGFSFDRENAGGLGAALHAVMLALHYARTKGHEFALVTEGMRFPRLNGSIEDTQEPDRTFHSYFASFPNTRPASEMVAVWRDCPRGWSIDKPTGFTGLAIEWYGALMKEIFQLQPSVQKEIERRIKKTPFCAETDVVLHIRRGDKIFKYEGSVIESDELPVLEYYERTLPIVKRFQKDKSVRVYLCCDDKAIVAPLREEFSKHNIDVVYDEKEPVEFIQAQRIGGKLPKSVALEENLTALTNLVIMSRGLFLVGGRMSYFFRVAELLRASYDTSLNIKDQEMFGKAPYAEPEEPFANPFHKRRYVNFCRPGIEDDNLLSETLARDYIITIPDFMSESAALQVLNDIPHFAREWWIHAVLPTTDGWKVRHMSYNDPQLAENVAISNKASDAGQFAYYFKRTKRGHYDTCHCFACRLHETFSSYEVMKVLSSIVGKRVVSMGEMFSSLYERDNYLTLHHDKQKGDYTFILSLTKDWNPCWGGLTQFYDAHTGSIYKSVSPKFNTLTIFRLTPERQMDHFVSRVCGPASRYAFTGWFNIE